MSGSANEDELAVAYQSIRAEATRLAGAPDAIPQRIVFLYELYVDSGGNHEFPVVALHGAAWGHGFFGATGPIARALKYRYFYDSAEQTARMRKLREFTTAFQAANREVFIDTYVNYHFAKQFGDHPQATRFVPRALLSELQRALSARTRGEHLAGFERARLFRLALEREQSRTVGPRIASALARFDCPVLKALVLRPVVRFAYFPAHEYLFFTDFSRTDERIEHARRAHVLAQSAAPARLFQSIRDYRILPNRFFADPLAYARELKQRLGVRPTAKH